MEPAAPILLYGGQVGVHGIVINFTDDRGSSYSATFLPEVAAEQGAPGSYGAQSPQRPSPVHTEKSSVLCMKPGSALVPFLFLAALYVLPAFGVCRRLGLACPLWLRQVGRGR